MGTTFSATVLAVIVAVSNAIVAVFSYILAVHNSKNDKQIKKKEDIKEAEKKLEDVCNNGSMSDLIDATKNLGDVKK